MPIDFIHALNVCLVEFTVGLKLGYVQYGPEYSRVRSATEAEHGRIPQRSRLPAIELESAVCYGNAAPASRALGARD
ncbi:hypothetical protein EVAR_56997_1 [Eumeta japonica]|uniref:Uncharacterized protein n=1 Tax=Eumeta variegata TaxID=151549 RepID=A0A4C1Z9P0_EUMVA|nr:hypothetical protein EVAR_56997_1 [Eumeta japonica]